jgi:hypothetical protein
MPGRAKIEKIGGQGNGQDARGDLSMGGKNGVKIPLKNPIKRIKKQQEK